MYNEEYFFNIKFKTSWSPTKEFLIDSFEKLSLLAFSNRGWYYSDKELDSYLDSLDINQIRYVWNTMPSARGGIITLLTKRISSNSSPDFEECRDIMMHLYNSIPSGFDTESVRLRNSFIPVLFSNYDYLTEVTNCRIANQEDAMTIWVNRGMSRSKDEKFYNFIWDGITREKGAVDRRLAVIKAALENDALSDKILNHCAKRGTKRMKRLVVNTLSDYINNVRRYRRSDDELLEREKELVAKYEERALLFATTDDSSVVDNLIDCLSVDNLPWVMPSASQFPWLLRKLNRVIERSRENAL